MSNTITQLPDPTIAEAAPKIQARVEKNLLEMIASAETFESIVDDTIQSVFSLSLEAASASEGTLWVADEEAGFLVPRYNTGPDSAALIKDYRHPLESGIIGTVFATQLAISESKVYRNQEHDPAVDQLLNKITVHLIAVPWFVGSEPVGIVSAVKLKSEGEDDPPKFEEPAFRGLTNFANLLGEIVEGRLVEKILQRS